MKSKIYLIIILAGCLSAIPGYGVVYVDIDAPGPGDGDSWGTAYNSIQTGIDDADVLDEDVWVAEGAYAESITTKEGVNTFGGYSGSGSTRDIDLYPTIIDTTGMSSNTIILDARSDCGFDGFTITGSGCGIYAVSGAGSTIIISNCKIVNNADYGILGSITKDLSFYNTLIAGNNYGGMYYSDVGQVLIQDSTVSGNFGIGIYNHQVNVTVNSSLIEGNFDTGIYCYDDRCYLQASNCTIRNNSDRGVIFSYDSSGELSNCTVISNNNGGICVRGGAYALINNCNICGNWASQGGGIYLETFASPTVTNCVISGNKSVSGGGIYYGGDNRPAFTNCIISGNKASSGGGAVFCNFAYGVFNNCTICDNDAPSGGAVNVSVGYDDINPTFRNCIFANNSNYAIFEAQENADPILSYCLFYNNPGGDYLDENATVYNGENPPGSGQSDTNNIPDGKATNNLYGEPDFYMGVSGSWDLVPSYNPATNLTTFTDSIASFTPSNLIGMLINPNISQRFQGFIVGNSETTIVVSGDLTGVVTIGNNYQVIDYYPDVNSAVIDMGGSTDAPATDIEGTARPIDVPGKGADGTGTEYDIGAYEAAVPPPPFVATMPFFEGFESGELAPYWESTGTNDYRTLIIDQLTPHTGSYHLLMDDSEPDYIYSRNELTLKIDLAGYDNLLLVFWAQVYSEEYQGPAPCPFTGGADFDGIAVSEDGITWYEALMNVSPPQNQVGYTFPYTLFYVDLDAAINVYGLSYDSEFYIRINHYDNIPIPYDGVVIDDISIVEITR